MTRLFLKNEKSLSFASPRLQSRAWLNKFASHRPRPPSYGALRLLRIVANLNLRSEPQSYAKTDMIQQVHGIGPFQSTLVDPVYQLTNRGVLLLTSLLFPGTPTSASPPDCFVLKLDDRVRGDLGEGVLAQRELEKRRSPLVQRFRPFGAGIF
jgi:hypothetical protein